MAQRGLITVHWQQFRAQLALRDQLALLAALGLQGLQGLLVQQVLHPQFPARLALQVLLVQLVQQAQPGQRELLVPMAQQAPLARMV